MRVVGWVQDPDTYPIQPKQHSFEFLRTIAHLRPRTNTIGAVLRVRNAASMAIHEFFQREEFCYLHTPIVTASDAEGAGEMFRVTTLPVLLFALIGSGDRPEEKRDAHERYERHRDECSDDRFQALDQGFLLNGRRTSLSCTALLLYHRA